MISGQPEEKEKKDDVGADHLGFFGSREGRTKGDAKGMSNQEIAETLFLSRRTIQSHLVNIFRKMDVGSRTEAVLQALKRGWCSLDELA